MSLIIAGTFDRKSEADFAVNALKRGGLPEDSVCIFAINPPGQHAKLHMGGDHDVSPGATDAGTGAAAGAAIGGALGLGVGLASTPVIGPAGPLSGAAVGAYIGSLAGALDQMGDENESSPAAALPRAAGVMVAVNATQSLSEALAIAVMRKFGAREIERVTGSWCNGVWEDFDPTVVPRPVSETA